MHNHDLGTCYACEWKPATRRVHGQGPMCEECFGNLTAIVRLTNPVSREQPARCGCTSVKIACQFAKNLRVRAKIAERRAIDTPEVDQAGRERLWTAYTNMMLALRGHHAA